MSQTTTMPAVAMTTQPTMVHKLQDLSKNKTVMFVVGAIVLALVGYALYTIIKKKKNPEPREESEKQEKKTASMNTHATVDPNAEKKAKSALKKADQGIKKRSEPLESNIEGDLNKSQVHLVPAGQKAMAGAGVSTKTTTINDDMFSFFENPDEPVAPGTGMPASYISGNTGKQSFENNNDMLLLPTTLTMDQHRKSLKKQAAMRPMSDGNMGNQKHLGQKSLRDQLFPAPDRSTSGTLNFGGSDSYYTSNMQIGAGGVQVANPDQQLTTLGDSEF